MQLKHQSALDAGFHMPAEWSPHERCWMAWPTREAIWGKHLEAARKGYANIAQAIAEFEPVCVLTPPGHTEEAAALCGPTVEIIPWDLDDSWLRDIGPNFLTNGEEIAVSIFHFNAWGQKYEKFRKDAALGHQLAEALGLRSFTSPLFMEGGGIGSDGEGTVLTTEQCVLNANRNPGLSKAEAERELCHALGAQKVIWLPGDPDDHETDGHVDGLACFIRPGAVLVELDGKPGERRHDLLMKNVRALEQARDARGQSLEIHFIAEASGMDAIGDRFCRSYINFYLANGGVVMPSYGIPADEPAREVLQRCFPDRKIVTVDVLGVATGGGGIHCITQQQPVSGAASVK
jgi:agmatine deiminase